MSSKSMERLQFVISLLDKVSAPLDKIQTRMKTFSDRADAGFQKAQQGAAGLVASVWTTASALNPGNDFMAGLGEVKSLNVAQESLDALQATALDFAAKYDVSAADVVRSSYDIQSAISGLKGDELAQFTQASALLAKGTKSDAGTITSYVGTMYGIFQESAEKMGKGEWVDQLAGQTATAVQIFKTTGPKMADAFSAIGSAGTSMGASMEEQMAILGTLQSTMEGGEAGTKYRAFLKGIGKAQDELGLKFTDSQGRMLPMVQILEKIKGKFGDIDTVAESDLMQKAFGSDEAVALVKMLSGKTDGLTKSMDQLSKVKGIDQAAAMADAMLTPLDKATGASKTLFTAFSGLMNNVMEPFFKNVSSGSIQMLTWLNMFPNLARWAAIAGLGILGLVAGVSLFALFGGIATLTMAGWSAAMVLMSGVMTTFSVVLNVLRLGTLLFNVALWANPITWVVAGVIALIAVCTLLWFKWDVLKAAFMDTAFGQGVMKFFSGASLLIDALIWRIGDLWQKFSDTSFVQSFSSAFQTLGEILGQGIAWLDNMAGRIGNLISAFASLAGSTVFQILSSPFQTAGSLFNAAGGGMTSLASAIGPSAVAPVANRIPGGAGKQIAGAMTQNNNSGPRIGEFNYHTTDVLTPEKLSHLAQFQS